VVHGVLDRFHRDVIAERLPQPDEQGWGADHRIRLLELLDETAERFERAGRTGRAAYWAVDRQRLRNELTDWLERDSAQAVARRARVIASEQRFGLDGEVTLALTDGRRIPVYGTVDRIDSTPTGLVVTDHKVGSVRTYADIAPDDPTAQRTRFQLPAYAAAASAIAGAVQPATLAGTPVRAEYSFLRKGEWKRIGYDVTPDVWRMVAADLEHVVSGVEAGWFPATAAKPKFQVRVECIFCDPDELGTAERYAEWDRKRHDPRLAPWFPTEVEAAVP
jgi:hypothetical protein